MNYKNIRLDKSLYNAHGGFSRQLEQLDPSEAYKDTPVAHLDAFQRQLKRFDIKVSGPHSDRISKFFSTSDSAALFPEYVSRAVASGMKENNLLESIVATTSVINSLDYRSLTSVLIDKGNPVIAEGGAIPESTLKLSDTLIRLRKRGQMLSASYEAIKHQRADVIAVALGQIGLSLLKSQINDGLEILIYGDGNDIPASDLTPVDGASFTYEHLLDLWAKFQDFELNTLLLSPKTARNLLALKEFRESTGGDSFVSGGQLLTPFGAKMVVSSTIRDEVVLGLDRRYALEMVTNGGIQVEYDKLIDTQLERAAVTTTYGFSKLFPEAVMAIAIT